MQELFKSVLSMSIGAGVLAGMVLIVRAVIGRRQTVVLTILFAMLIAKLIVPLSIESDASVFNLLPSSISEPMAAEVPMDMDKATETTKNYVAISDSETTLEYGKEAVQDTTAENEVVSTQPVNLTANTANTVAPDKPAKPISPWQIAAIVWLCGMAALTVVITASNVAFIRKVSKNRTYTSPGFDELLRNCADEFGIKQKIRAVQMSEINTVAVCGIFRPKLLVSPETFDKLSMHEKKNVLMHELSHIKRKDTLTCLIITVVNILHWFNPIVWAAFAVFRKDIEVMCDAKVLRKMDNAGRRSYANTLFTLAKNTGKTNTRFAMALFMSKATIKRRIAMIAKYKKNSPLIVALALILTVGLAVTGCTIPKTDDVEIEGKAEDAAVKEKMLDAQTQLPSETHKCELESKEKIKIEDTKGELAKEGFAILSEADIEYNHGCNDEAFKEFYEILTKLETIELNSGETTSLRELAGFKGSNDSSAAANDIEWAHNVSPVGGDTCTIATAIYNAAIRGGLEVSEVTHHVAVPDGLPVGLDIVFNKVGGDLKITNPYHNKIIIKTTAMDGGVHCEVLVPRKGFGEGRSVEYEVKVTQIGEAPRPMVYYDTVFLPNGEEIPCAEGVVYVKGAPQLLCEVYKVQSGKQERILFETVEYEACQAQVYVNGDHYEYGSDIYLNIDLELSKDGE